MERFTVYIDLPIEAIERAYIDHFGFSGKPTRKDLSSWIASLAEADIETVLSQEE